ATTNIASGAAATTNIGTTGGTNTIAGTTTINATAAGSTAINTTANPWNVSAAGAANFVSIGLVNPGSGAFTTLTSSGASTIGTGAGLTNSFGSGGTATNTFGTN